MSLNPKTYEEALLKHKPMKRSRLVAKTFLRSISRKAKPSKKKVKKKKVTKKHVWKQFSIWVRLREADAEGWVVCVTCGVKKFWKDMQAGHFIRGRLNANIFDERGCHAQCYQCNIHYQGNVVLYYRFMLSFYGQKVIDELIQQNSKTKKWAAGELAALLEKYKGLNSTNPLTAKEIPQ